MTLARTILLILALALPAMAADDEGAALLRRLQAELREGRHAEALATARQAAALDLAVDALWYNLAGLEEQHGERDRAVVAFERAVELGFDDFRHADRDEDLAGLRDDPAYQALRTSWSAGLAAHADGRAATLEGGQWSPAFPLPDRRGGLDPPRVTVRLRPGASALECELTIAGHEMTSRAPWQGGSGVLITVTLPESGSSAEGVHHAEFGFGLADGLPAGAVRLGRRWQRVAELTPKFKVEHDTGDLQVALAIPWTLCANLHPLVDETLGVNITYLRRGGELPTGRAAWLDDPAAGRTDRDWRRGVPVRWTWPPQTGLLVHGRPRSLVVRDAGFELAPLVVVAPDEQPVPVQLVVRDGRGRIRHQETWTLEGPAGRRVRSGELPVELPVGSVRLGASSYDPRTEASATWQTELVSLPVGWEEATAARIVRLPGRERPSLQHRLDAVVAELASRSALADPSALGATVDEVEDLLDRFEATGTTLPAGGSYLAVMPGPADRPPARCSLALPEGWRRGDPVRTLLLLVRTTGGEQQAVTLAPRLVAEAAAAREQPPPAVVLAVPHLGEQPDDAGGAEAIARLIDWLQDFLGCGPVHLAGVDLQAATVLELAAKRPRDVAGILMLTGMGFTPYPGEDAAALAGRVVGLDPALPAGWLWFPEEQQSGDQSAALRRGLRASGLRLEPARPIAGGLDFGQAWQRSLLWALQPSP